MGHRMQSADVVSVVGDVDWPHIFRAGMWACVHGRGWKF